MCDAMSMMMGMQAVGQLSQGRAAQKTAEGDAYALEAGARMDRLDGESNARRVRRAGIEARGAAVSGAAAAGVKIGEGSALDVERQVMEDYSADEYFALLNGNQRADQRQTEAKLRRLAGRDAKRAGQTQAATTLLGSGVAGARASGWGQRGPGFSGWQAAAPVEDRGITGVGGSYGGRY